jgi:hypothetical protein
MDMVEQAKSSIILESINYTVDKEEYKLIVSIQLFDDKPVYIVLVEFNLG